MIIRPIAHTDYPALLAMAIESGHGFTSLPVDEKLLKQRIEKSVGSFSSNVDHAGNESYLFVIEDQDSHQAVGICGIEAAVGLKDPFYHYRLGTVIHSSRELNIYNSVETLSLCNDYTGSSELCTLFLLPQYRKNNNGSLLSRCRFLFMAEFLSRFSSSVIAELRGVSDENGRSPFWNWLEQNFFSLDFPTADYLSGIGKKVFIAELMPKYPIYVNLLSAEAQISIGKVHQNTKPALSLLEKEGFEMRGYVDIFDAGPTVEAKINNIRSIKENRRYQVNVCKKLPKPSVVCNSKQKQRYIIANTQITNFRAVISELIQISSQHELFIVYELATALHIKSGDSVRVLAL